MFIYDLKNKKELAYLEFFFPLSLKTMRNNCSSPHNGPIKKLFPKILNLSLTNNEIVETSKSEPKKFSFLFTFKLSARISDLWKQELRSRWSPNL